MAGDSMQVRGLTLLADNRPTPANHVHEIQKPGLVCHDAELSDVEHVYWHLILMPNFELKEQ